MLEAVPGSRCSILTLIGLLAGAAACGAGTLDQSPGAGGGAPAAASVGPGVAPPVPVPPAVPPPLPEPASEPTGPGPCEQCARRDSTRIVQLPLACYCGSNGRDNCGVTLQRARRERCAEGEIPPGSTGVLQITGCGKVLLSRPTGLGQYDQIFDQGSGRLVGVRSFSDVIGRCRTSAVEYGDSWRRLGTVDPDCPEVQTCMLCGEPPPGERFRDCR